MEISWALSLMIIKISILLFYIRIFAVPSFRLAAQIVMGIVVLWALAVILQSFLLCRPVSYNWNTQQPGTCGNRVASYVGCGSSNIITDAFVLCLPLPMVWNLQVPRANKVALSTIFGLGFL